jgi:hypothetical protein
LDERKAVVIYSKMIKAYEREEVPRMAGLAQSRRLKEPRKGKSCQK